MPPVVAVVLILAIAAYFLANRRALAIAGGRSAELHSRPGYYASYAALMAAGPALALWAAWRLLEPVVLRHLVLRRGAIRGHEPAARNRRLLHECGAASRRAASRPSARSRRRCRPRRTTTARCLTFSRIALLVAGVALAAVLPLRRTAARPARLSCAQHRRALGHRGPVAAPPASRSPPRPASCSRSLFESIRFFRKVPITEFLFGLQWSPQTALRADQVGSSGRVRRRAAVRGHAADHADRDAGRRADRHVLGDLPVAVREPRLPQLGQADPGDPGRHPDRGLRLLRCADRGAADPRAPASRSGSTSPRRAPWRPGWSWAS